jgi:hypothetical protein
MSVRKNGKKVLDSYKNEINVGDAVFIYGEKGDIVSFIVDEDGTGELLEVVNGEWDQDEYGTNAKYKAIEVIGNIEDDESSFSSYAGEVVLAR